MTRQQPVNEEVIEESQPATETMNEGAPRSYLRSIKGPDFRLTVGEGQKAIIVNGKIYYFSRDYSGCPWLETKSGVVKDTPSPRSRFWYGFYAWTRQGERMESGLCIWDPPPKRVVRHLADHRWWIVSSPPGWMETDGIEIEAPRHD